MNAERHYKIRENIKKVFGEPSRKAEIENLLNAIGRGWVVGYTKAEIDALKAEYRALCG